ncbi:MAG: hypothetical protein IT269_05540 [Saprospiraceae bacterium]|nr:hypothetical protein [Saprospiraceae bacterium]
MKNCKMLLVLIVFFGAKSVHAQFAAYYCAKTGIYGFCVGSSDVEQCAYNYCVSYGGRSPRLVGSVVYEKGYAAIAIGYTANGGHAIGVAAGARTQLEADRLALQYCRKYGAVSPYIDARAFDL